MGLLKPIIVSAVTLFLLSWVLPTVSFSNWTTLLLAAVVLTFIQALVKPILKLIFLPINIITLGLFSMVLNVVLLWLVTYLVPGFSIQAMVLFGVSLNQFFSLLVTSFLISLIQNMVDFIL
jgi:putative membrane protein